MSTEGLIIGLVIVLVSILWAALPLRRRESRRAGDDVLLQKQRERLLLIYERVLTNIRDLDEDHSTGKMQDDSYEAERESWVERGIQVLKALDRLDAHHAITSSDDDAVIDRAIDDEIEQAIAAYRAKVGS